MLESVNNQRIRDYAKLNEKKYREEQGLFLVEGEHLVSEALKKGCVKEIFLLKGETNPFGEVTFVTSEVLKKLTSLTNPPKVIAVCHKLPEGELIGNIIMLDDINNPGNLGTIIRSAVAFNYETIILSPETVDVYNPKVIRATEGMLFNVNIIISDLKTALKTLEKSGYLIFGTDVKTGREPEPLAKKHALLIGSEAAGIKPEILSLCTQKLCLKMNPLCESLNAGVSASILMYELNKVRW